jgi:hypothetical protein
MRGRTTQDLPLRTRVMPALYATARPNPATSLDEDSETQDVVLDESQHRTSTGLLYSEGRPWGGGAEAAVALRLRLWNSRHVGVHVCPFCVVRPVRLDAGFNRDFPHSLPIDIHPQVLELRIETPHIHPGCDVPRQQQHPKKDDCGAEDSDHSKRNPRSLPDGRQQLFVLAIHVDLDAPDHLFALFDARLCHFQSPLESIQSRCVRVRP